MRDPQHGDFNTDDSVICVSNAFTDTGSFEPCVKRFSDADGVFGWSHVPVREVATELSKLGITLFSHEAAMKKTIASGQLKSILAESASIKNPDRTYTTKHETTATITPGRTIADIIRDSEAIEQRRQAQAAIRHAADVKAGWQAAVVKNSPKANAPSKHWAATIARISKQA